jgi:hypothetical protein
MPKSKVIDPITDQEIAFARLVLSGGMTDRQAAVAVGLNPESAAYTKAKPRVRAYLLEHRAAVQQQLVQQDADLSRRAADGQRRLNPEREQVLNRLWELASLSPDMTRGSITGQVKCLAMIAAIQNFIPDRRALRAEKNPAPVPVNAQIYQSAWLRQQQATTNDPQPPPALDPKEDPKEDQQEEASAVPACPGVPWRHDLAPSSRAEAPPPVPSQPTFAHRVPLADGRPPYVPDFTSVPDTRVPFSIKVNPFKPRR